MNANKRFLLIDDDRDDRELFAEALEEVSPNIGCRCVSNWEKACEVLRAGHTDLIFIDINLPLISGWECLRMLKESEEYKHIPVIIYSTSSHEQDIAMAKALGAVELITKPSDFTELKAMLERAVEQYVVSS